MREKWTFDRRCVFGCCYHFRCANGDALWVSVDYFWASPEVRRVARLTAAPRDPVIR